jgi:hypothetical protein
VWGLSPGALPGISVHDFRFRSEAAPLVRDGAYAVLGQAGGTLYIQPCGGRHPIVGVEESPIIGSVLKPEGPISAPSLWDVVTRGATVSIGYRPPC